MNTRLEYAYRDNSNYKRSGSVLLSGVMSDSDRALVYAKLEMGEMFVAEQLGIPSLRSLWFLEGVKVSSDDNGWHYLLSVSEVEESEPTLMPASELINRVRAVDVWRLSMADTAT